MREERGKDIKIDDERNNGMKARWIDEEERKEEEEESIYRLWL